MPSLHQNVFCQAVIQAMIRVRIVMLSQVNTFLASRDRKLRQYRHPINADDTLRRNNVIRMHVDWMAVLCMRDERVYACTVSCS